MPWWPTPNRRVPAREGRQYRRRPRLLKRVGTGYRCFARHPSRHDDHLAARTWCYLNARTPPWLSRYARDNATAPVADRQSGHASSRGLQFWSMSTLPLSEVKARLSEIAEEVAATHERVQITRNGREYVVLLAAEDLESIEATLELLSDPDAQSRLASAERDIEQGDVLDEAAVRALLPKSKGAE